MDKSKNWVRLAQTGWWIFATLSLLLFLVTVPIYFQELSQICYKTPCLAMQLTVGQAIILELSGFRFSLYAGLILAIQVVVYILNLAIGSFIYFRRSFDWLAIFVSLMLITSIPADLLVGFQIAYPSFKLLAILLLVLNSLLWIVFFYIFPTGSFYPRWTVFLAVFWILILSINSIFPSLVLISQNRPEPINFLPLAGMVLTGITVLLYRYRSVFNPIQRDQTKWVVYGVVIAWGGQIVFSMLRLALPILLTNAFYLITWNLLTLAWSLILPVSILFAVLSSNLMDIDVLIRRTLAYTSVTIILLLVYIGSVLVLQTLFEMITGQRSPVVSIISTLVIAAMSSPLRLRVQDGLNRTFFRYHYNAELAVQEFSASARSDVDLDEISKELVHTVQNTLQPEFLSLWMCKISEDIDLESEDILR